MHNQKWKVLIAVEATAAGVGRHVTDVLSGLDLNRFDVTLAWSPTRSDERFRERLAELAALGVRIEAIPMSRAIDPRADLRALLSLMRLIFRERYDLVHGHSSKAGFLVRLAARLAHSSALTVYSPNSISIPLNPAYWYPEKAAGWLTDAIVAVSESERRELSDYQLVPSRKLHHVTAGIAIPENASGDRQSLRRELCLPEDAIVIGTIGRLSFQKDPDTFVKAAETVVRDNEGVRFIWIGDGEQLDSVRQLVSAKGLADKVRLVGYRKDAERLLSAVDIFVLTSRYESFGYVTCEAMAAGKPVVASRVTGSSELVEPGVTGILVEPGDAVGFASALQLLISDPALRRSFGAAGRQRIEQRFSISRMVAEIEKLYEDLLTGTTEKVPPRSLPGRFVEVK